MRIVVQKNIVIDNVIYNVYNDNDERIISWLKDLL